MGDSSSGSDIEEFSGIEQPPLIQQLKTILDEYRNDVQIIKELVQNADDAEATTMKILYEGRNINEEQPREGRYRKFIRAPALVFYNDAEFSETDWRGIRSIYSSGKKEDPMKIGRYGLGFKSVFHLTDYPCIISGHYILFINPHERQSGRVCVTIKLKNLRKLKGRHLSFEDFMNALDGTFGFSENAVAEGHYAGTLFWFPLRQRPSELSDNIYEHKDVYALLEAFIEESPRSLIFVKTLCKIELYVNVIGSCLPQQDSNGPQERNEKELEDISFGKDEYCFSVSIENSESTLVYKRLNILKELHEIGDAVPEQSKYWLDDAFVRIHSKSRTRDDKVSKTRWLILNYLKGGELSDRIQILKKDKDLLYPHLVGLAAPINEDGEYRSTGGHVFCFQPLPQESSSVTGLPVHVNAFFALTQNRRHIRWPDDNDKGLANSDKKIEWNLRLMAEILPDAYAQLLRETVSLCHKEKSLKHALYNAIPSFDKVQEHWKSMAKHVVKLCSTTNMNVLYTETGHWSSVDSVLIADERSYKGLTETCYNTVLQLAVLDNVPVCTTPPHVTDTFNLVGINLSFLTPEFLRRHLVQHPGYKQLSFDKKQDLLEFLLQDLSEESLVSLELLPLADGSFTFFSTSLPTYQEDKDTVDLFLGQEERFVSTSLRSKLSSALYTICERGSMGLQRLQATDAKQLLKGILKLNFGSPPIIQGSDAEKQKSWIQKVWTLIQTKFSDCREIFLDLEIFPAVDGQWDTCKVIPLFSTDSLLLHAQHFHSNTEDQVKKAFSLLSVSVVRNIPDWIDYGVVRQFIHEDTGDGLLEIFSRVSNKHIHHFNEYCSDEVSQMFLEYLSERIHEEISEECRTKMIELEVFRAFESLDSFERVSLKHSKTYYCHKDFPVKFPRRLLILSDMERTLAARLGAELVSDEKIALEALDNYKIYTVEERMKLVRWIVQNESILKCAAVQDRLKTVPFLTADDNKVYTPSQLFDPTDAFLVKLFRGQHVFPLLDIKDQIFVSALKNLGLKTRSHLSADDLIQQCNLVHEMALGSVSFDKDKCYAFLQAMNENIRLVDKTYVQSKRCVLVEMEKLSDSKDKGGNTSKLRFPTDVKTKDFLTLIGSVLFTIDTSSLPYLTNMFEWSKPPDVSQVVQHLRNVVRSYQPSQKPQTLHILNDVYHWFHRQNQLSVETLKSMLDNCFEDMGYVWVGDGFQSPDRVFVEKGEGDIDLTPFLFELPTEIKDLSDFFTELGCSKHVKKGLLVRTLQQIKEVCDAEDTEKTHSEQRLLQLAIAILNKLHQDSPDGCEDSDNIYFPVEKEGKLTFCPAKQCTYCDFDWLQDVFEEEDFLHIHPKVPIETAKNLGVPSLRQQLMSSAEAFEEWGQEEPLTRRLRTLLKEGYVDGFSVVKEMFQNADDAGAKRIWIMYDERENSEARKHLLNDGMAKCQGPAIWFYNDAHFTENDLENITKISGATKASDATKIGKFGLGFCSVYNLTDVPSFISGENMVIFDPHTTFLGKTLPSKSPGLKINFKLMRNQRMLKRMKNQFKPFEGVFGCQIFEDVPNFSGTLFRLPLRTCSSEISDVVYTPKDVLQLLNMIMDRSANMFLFNQNIKELKLFHLTKTHIDPSEMSLLFEVQREVTCILPSLPDPSIRSVLKKASELKRKGKLSNIFCLIEKVIITGKRMSDVNEQICDTTAFQGTWLISWATGSDERTLQLTETESGAICLGSVAVPVDLSSGLDILSFEKVSKGFYQKGHIFCFLPLPIEHDFPFHINSQFAVSSDRRHLISSTEDDRNTEKKEWNECLLKDAVTHALLSLLQNIHSLGILSSYRFDQLWPQTDNNQLLHCLPEAFYKQILKPKEYRVFVRGSQWFDISECLFLEQNFRQSEDGDIATEAMLQLNDRMLDVTNEIYNLMLSGNSQLVLNKTVSKQSFFTNYFLPNLKMFYKDEAFSTKTKKRLVQAVLENDSQINEWLKNNECVPSCPSDQLKRPSELVDPTSKLSVLYCKDDGYFPSELFCSVPVLERLRHLGLLCNNLPDEYVVGRAMSVANSEQVCGCCALERCSELILYLSTRLLSHERCFAKLGQISFLPVEQKPQDWPFSWRKESQTSVFLSDMCVVHNCFPPVAFEKPFLVYHPDCSLLVGCIRPVLDARFLARHALFFSSDKVNELLGCLGVNGILTTNEKNLNKELNRTDCIDIAKQLYEVAENYEQKHKDKTSQIVMKIYTWFEKYFSKQDLNKILGEVFVRSDYKYIWIGNGFQQPSNVYAQVCENDIDLTPFKFAIPSEFCHLKEFFIQLGCISCLNLDTYIKTLQEIKYESEDAEAVKKCSTERLLKLSVSVLNKINEEFHLESKQTSSELYFPVLSHNDELKFVPVYQCFYSDYQWLQNAANDEDLFEIHPKVPLDTAAALGVPSLRQRLLLQAEAFEEWGQEEPLTTRLKHLLAEGYVDGFSVAKELFQNADDAGARRLWILYDERENEDARDQLLNEDMAQCQGPATVKLRNLEYSGGFLKCSRFPWCSRFRCLHDEFRSFLVKSYTCILLCLLAAACST